MSVAIPIPTLAVKLVWRGDELPKLSDQSPIQSGLPFVYIALIVLGVLLVLAVTARLWRKVHHSAPAIQRIVKPRPSAGAEAGGNPAAVFRRVAGELGLARADQRLLGKIAQSQGLPSPLTLLLSPATLGHHVAAHTADMAPNRRDQVLDRVAALEQQVFGE